MIRAVHSHITHKDAEFWVYLLNHAVNAQAPTVEATVAGKRVVFTADPENMRAILASQFSDFGKGEGFRNDWHGLLGDSVFSMDGENWHAARQLLRPQFIKNRVSDLVVFEKYVQILLRAFAGGEEAMANPNMELKGVGKKVNLTSLIHRYTLDTATEFLFGKSVGSLQDINNEFAEAFEVVQQVQSTRTRAGYVQKFQGTFKSADRVNRPAKMLFSTTKMNHGIGVINSIAFPYIDLALSLSPYELASNSSPSNYTFLHALASISRDRVFLRDQIVSLLLAGRDTTASILIWIFYEMARHPEIYAKLRNEVLNTVGPFNPPTYAHLKSMKYLQAVMNETLMLYPLPFNIRITLRDTCLPRGGGSCGDLPVGMPAGTPVGFSTLNLHHNAKLFPPPSKTFASIEDFSPERWESWHPRPWTYIPFSGGPRICLGQQFALTEMGYTLVRVAQKFQALDWPEGRNQMTCKTNIMIEPVDDLIMRFWEAK